MAEPPRTLQGVPEAPQVPKRGAEDDTLPASVPPNLDPVSAPRLTVAERYRLGAELGRGGMGRVVEAFDVQLGRTVALKEVLPRGGEGIARRFAREVQLTARLEHPSIVPLYDSGTTVDGRPFYVMRRVSGRPLDELVARARGLGERLTLLPAVLAAIDAVAHAHRRGVIHRDLKPANILVGDLGETVVIDWGLAKVIGEEDEHTGESKPPPDAADSLQTQIGAVFGTPGFMAPEQARGEELGTRGDVYALGATLYQVLGAAPPHAGNSATEVIDRTRKHEMRPLGDIAPGTPPELIAIVDKALAFDPKGRYANAGALGEDVRRFLAGQLVAAHHYTTAQRVRRFAKRHRSPLAVAALALVAVAVLAWISVSRVLRERDAANDAREAEARGKVVAEKALAEAEQRADQLTVMQARAFIDKNPTLAAALLKQLPAASTRAADGKGAAQAAAVRGIAWALQGPDELTLTAALSPDSQYMLQTTRDGVLRVWDVERRRLALARPYSNDPRALWVAGGKRILVMKSEGGAELLDPFGGAVQAVPLGAVQYAVTDAQGDRVLFIGKDRAAGVLDVATRTAAPLWAGHAASEIAIAADGAWLALGDDKELVVLDASGAVLASRATEVVRIEASRFDSFGVLDGKGGVTLCELAGGTATWTEMPVASLKPNRVLDLAFRGKELVMFATSGQVLGWGGTRLVEHLRLDTFGFHLVEAGDGLVLAPSSNGKIYYASRLVHGELLLPAVLPNLRVLSRGGSQRVIAIGRGLIVGFELDDIMPRRIEQPIGTIATFAGDDTLLFWRNAGEDWAWYDIASGASTPFTYSISGIPQVVDVDPLDGRVLVQEGIAEGTRLVLLHKGVAGRTVLAKGPAAWGRLLPGGALVFGIGDGRLFAAEGSGEPREIAKLEGIAENAVAIGRGAYAAVSTSGELVRGDLASGSLTRAHVHPGTTGVIGVDRRGRPLLAEDNRLLVWDGDVVELARFDKPIVNLAALDDGIAVELSTHELDRVGLTPGAPPTRLFAAGQAAPVVSRDGHLALGTAVNGSLAVIELPSGVAWELPVLYQSTEQLAIAPTSRRILQSSFSELALWSLPQAGPDLRAWLDERTNAQTDGEHQLAWPWQLPAPATR